MAKKLAPFSALQKAKDYIDSKLNTKVDKVSGKGLSTNDYTTTEKNKLSGIASGAEVNVQSDWNQSTTTADDYIKNKPSSLPASDVYAWAKASTKPSYSASEVGLGNVGNFKAVSTVANQGLSTTEKQNAIANIDALPKWCDLYNGYIKRSDGSGQWNYYKIGTIKITTAYVNYPLVLEISGRGILYTTLQIMYNSSDTTDPALDHFRSNTYNGFYIIKTATSTWDIFGVYSQSWGNAALHKVTGTIPEGIQFKIGMTSAGSIPSGAIQATYWGHSLQADILTNFENNNSTGKNANDVTFNAHTYYTSNGPSTALGASTNEGALFTQAYSSSWVAQIAQDYRNGRLFVRGKNNGTWQDWKRIAITGESQPASDVYAWAKASTKPSYSASEVGAIATTAKGAANGVASLGSDGKVPSSQLPESGGIQEITLWENADPSQNQASTNITNPLVATPAGMKMLRVYYVTKYDSDNKHNKVTDLPLVPVGWSGNKMWIRSKIFDWGSCTDLYWNQQRHNCVLCRDISYYSSSMYPDTYPNGAINIGNGYYSSMEVAYNPQSYPAMTGDFSDAMIVTKITALVY